MTYVVLVILIALWALVLLPPYLKDRRSSSRAFSAMQRGPGSVGGAQRFLPLQQARPGYATAAVTAPTGIRAMPTVPAMGADSNVVPFRPTNVAAGGPVVAPTRPVSAAQPVDAPGASFMLNAESAGAGVPRSKSAARERRRQVLMGLTAVAFVTLLGALAFGGTMVALHVLVDVCMLGYVILLVRHRQLEAVQSSKIEPIRPPVTEHAPASLQVAPAYLLRSGT